MRALDGIDDVLMAHSLKVYPYDAVALREVFGARYAEFVGAVQRVGVRRGTHREPPEVFAPAVESREADSSDQSHRSTHSRIAVPLPMLRWHRPLISK